MKRKIEWKQYGLLFLYACIVMFLCAGSSPLIQYLSPDSSIFYTMGRSAANGTILYKEIADHKGFYLFLFNWIGAWLTPNSMNGLFFVEIIFAWFKLIFLYKIARLYEVNSKKCVLASILFMAVATNFLSWNTGNLGEQFALLFQLISLYYIAVYVEKNRESGCVNEHRPIYMMVHGICAGIVLFIQANLVAMWIPFGLGLAYLLIRSKYIKNFFVNLGYLLLGAGLATLPVLMYGIVNKCIEDMYYIMFEVNFMYSADGRVGKTILGFVKEFVFSPSFVIVILAILGTVVVARFYKNVHIGIIYGSMLMFSIVCMSVSLNANPIYYTVYMPFMVPFCIWLVHFTKEKWFLVQCILVLCVTVGANMQIMKKVLNIGKSGYAYESAYQMSELIENKESSKILVLGNSLYYNCTNTLPHIKYFTIFVSGLRYETFPYCIDEQYQSLCSGENDYIMIQFKGDSYDFWNESWRNETMKEYLLKEYELALEYNEGGIHSALYERK